MIGCGQCRGVENGASLVWHAGTPLRFPHLLENAARFPHCPQPRRGRFITRRSPTTTLYLFDHVVPFSVITWRPFQGSTSQGSTQHGSRFDDQMVPFSIDKNRLNSAAWRLCAASAAMMG